MAGWNEWIPGTNMTLTEVLDSLKSARVGLDVKDKLYWSFYKMVELAIKEGNANFDVEMARGVWGTLADRLNNELITMGKLDQSVKEAMTGGSVAVVGPEAVGNINIQDRAVSSYHTDFIEKTLVSTTDTDIKSTHTFTQGKLVDINTGEITDNPLYLTSEKILMSDGDRIFVYRGEGDSENMTLIYPIVFYDHYDRVIGSQGQISNPGYVSHGGFSHGYFYTPPRSTAYAIVSPAENRFDTQTYLLVKGNYKLHIPNLLTASTGGGLSDKTIACFGDSITDFGNYPDVIADRTGATVINAGIGGTRLGKHGSAHWDKFSVYNIVDALISGDWTEQDAALSSVTAPRYQDIKNIDLSGVDIVTFLALTNDFAGTIGTGSTPLGELTDTTPDTARGAINYVIKQLQTHHPHIQILFITPIWRSRISTGDGLDTDIHPNRNGDFLVEFADSVIELANRNHVESLDLFRKSGFNKFTEPELLDDGVHPTPKGYDQLGNKIASYLMSHF